MAKPSRVAVIGRSGKGDYGHGLDVVWKSIAGVEIVAVADEDEKGRQAAAARIGAKNAYADYRQMLEKERPEFVSVAPRWPDHHRDMVLACARAGAHIFLEKPMARTLAEADEMIAQCEIRHVKLAIAHQTRYSPRVERIRELIADGTLGDILELRGRGKEDGRGGGEDLMVLGTHIMDLIRWFAKDARWCHARIRHKSRSATQADIRPGGENIGPVQGDSIHATYEFDAGIEGTFATVKDKGLRASRFGLQILGSKGIVQLTTGSLPAAFFLPDPTWFPGQSKVAWQPITSAGLGKPERLTDAGLGAGNQWIAQDLLLAAKHDRQPRGNMYDGRAALEMILAVYESHRLGQTVELPLKTRRHPLTVQ
jgi:predicted dehydrogenase